MVGKRWSRDTRERHNMALKTSATGRLRKAAAGETTLAEAGLRGAA
jgi:hypothetical protein